VVTTRTSVMGTSSTATITHTTTVTAAPTAASCGVCRFV
jgi:hypothetical protein